MHSTYSILISKYIVQWFNEWLISGLCMYIGYVHIYVCMNKGVSQYKGTGAAKGESMLLPNRHYTFYWQTLYCPRLGQYIQKLNQISFINLLRNSNCHSKKKHGDGDGDGDGDERERERERERD